MRSPEVTKALEIFMFTVQGEDADLAKVPKNIIESVTMQSIGFMGNPGSKTRESFNALLAQIDKEFLEKHPEEKAA